MTVFPNFSIRTPKPAYFRLGLGALALGLLSVSGLPLPDHALTWQVITGAAMAGLMIYQWVLLLARLTGRQSDVIRHTAWHKIAGVALILLFALHVPRFGYMWTSIITLVFLANAVVGVMNRETLRIKHPRFQTMWLWLHTCLSAMLMPLVALHIWIALIYE